MSVHEDRKPVVTTSLTHGMIHMYMLILPQVLTLMRQDLGLSLRHMGLLANIAGLAFGLCALPSGLATDRFGAKRVIPLTLLGMAVSSFLIGIAPSFGTLCILFALLGISGGFYHPAGVSLLSWVAKKRGPAMGLHGIVGNIFFALGPFLTGGIAAIGGWRASYLVLGALGVLITGVAFWGLGGVGLQPAKSIQEEKPSSSARGGNHLAGFFLVCIGAALTGLVFAGTTLFLPTYLIKMVEKTSLVRRALFLGSVATSLAYFMGVLGQYVGGELSDRLRLDYLFLVGLVLTIPFLILTGLPSPLVILPAAMAFAFFHFLLQPVGNSLVAEFTPLGWRGMAYGIFFFSSYGIGSFSNTLSAYIGERWGLSAVFFALAIISAVAVLFTLPLVRLYHPKKEAQGQGR